MFEVLNERQEKREGSAEEHPRGHLRLHWRADRFVWHNGALLRKLAGSVFSDGFGIPDCMVCGKNRGAVQHQIFRGDASRPAPEEIPEKDKKISGEIRRPVIVPARQPAPDFFV